MRINTTIIIAIILFGLVNERESASITSCTVEVYAGVNQTMKINVIYKGIPHLETFGVLTNPVQNFAYNLPVNYPLITSPELGISACSFSGSMQPTGRRRYFRFNYAQNSITSITILIPELVTFPVQFTTYTNTVKVTIKYNTPAWENDVPCQSFTTPSYTHELYGNYKL